MSRMKRLCLIVSIWVFCTLRLFAFVSSADAWLVQGVLMDSLTRQPEMYATLRFYKLPDRERAVASLVSGPDGRFQVSLFASGSYLLKVSSVGKEGLEREFELLRNEKVKDLGALWMQDDVRHLAEISVVAAKPLVKADVDKTIYNVEDDPDSSTSTLIEMLRKVPLVTVDADDNIQVNGHSSFRIYMNGRPSNMLSNNPAGVLRSIPAHTIKKIEVITDPGAKYDAEGVSGVLNIVTKGAEFEGYNVNLNTVVLNNVTVAGGYGMMKFGRLSLSGNYNYSNYRSKIKMEEHRLRSDSPAEADLGKWMDIRTSTPGHYAAVEGSFELDSLNLLSLSGSLDVSNGRETYRNRYTLRDAVEAWVYAYRERRYTDEKWGGGSLKMDYQHQFRRKKTEMLTLSYQFDYAPNDRNSETEITDRTGNSPSLKYVNAFDRQLNRARGHAYTFQVDYVNPLTPVHGLEAGLKYICRRNTSEARSEQRQQASLPWQASDFQPVLDYRHLQHILGIYAGYNLVLGKWGLKTGLRMERTWQQVAYRKGEGEDFDMHLTDWVPSVSLSRKLTDRQQLRVAYNLRLRRPGIDFLNPYVQLSGAEIRYGNPQLTSEKHHRISLTYHYFSPKINVQATTLLSVGRNCIGKYQFIDADGILNNTYGNIEQVLGGGVNGYIGYNPSAYTSLAVNGTLNYLSIRSKNDSSTAWSDLHNEGFCGTLYLSFTQRFKKGWRIMASEGYFRPELTLGAESFNYYYYGINLAKTFFNDRLTVMLRVQDFATRYLRLTRRENYPEFRTVRRERYDKRAVGLAVSFRFGDLKTTVKKALRSISNDDMKKGEE